jgi:hypothetical protein
MCAHISVLCSPSRSESVALFPQAAFHSELLEEFLKQHGEEYRSVKRIGPSDEMKESEARGLAM